MFTCVVCHEKFKDGWDHALKPYNDHGGLLGYKDQAHAEYAKKVEDKMYHDQKCFCGGHISQRGWGSPDGGASWETTCDDCEFLWDED